MLGRKCNFITGRDSMVDNDDDTQEPGDEVLTTNNTNAVQPKGRRPSFNNLPQDITPEDLASPGYHKMLVLELKRLDDVEAEFKAVSTDFHTANNSLTAMKERLKTHNAFEIISTGCIAIASALFGAAFSIRESNNTFFWILVILSLVLVLIGIVAKVFKP
jgi:hypothetical protein